MADGKSTRFQAGTRGRGPSDPGDPWERLVRSDQVARTALCPGWTVSWDWGFPALSGGTFRVLRLLMPSPPEVPSQGWHLQGVSGLCRPSGRHLGIRMQPTLTHALLIARCYPPSRWLSVQASSLQGGHGASAQQASSQHVGLRHCPTEVGLGVASLPSQGASRPMPREFLAAGRGTEDLGLLCLWELCQAGPAARDGQPRPLPTRYPPCACSSRPPGRS